MKESVEIVLGIASKISWPRLIYLTVIALIIVAMLNAEGIAKALS